MTYDSVILADTPLGYWKCDGDEADDSGNNRDAAPNNVFMFTAGGGHASSPAGRVVLAATTTDWANLPVTVSGSDWSLEFWIKTTATSGLLFSGILSATGNPDTISARMFTGGLVQFGWEKEGTGSGRILASTTVAVHNDAWHHVVGVWDGTSGAQLATSQFKIYVDGVDRTSGTFTTGGTPPTAPITGPTDTYHLGGASSWAIAAACQMDSVAVYGTALSAGQVAAHFAAVPINALLSGGGQLTAQPAVLAALSGGGQLQAIFPAAVALSGGGQLQAIFPAAAALSGGGEPRYILGWSPENPAPDAPSIPGDLSPPVGVTDPKLRRKSQTYPAPTLIDGIPQGWSPT